MGKLWNTGWAIFTTGEAHAQPGKQLQMHCALRDKKNSEHSYTWNKASRTGNSTRSRDMPVHLLRPFFPTVSKAAHAFRLLLDAISNISQLFVLPAHRTRSTLSVQLTRYINYLHCLLTYLQTYTDTHIDRRTRGTCGLCTVGVYCTSINNLTTSNYTHAQNDPPVIVLC